MARLGRGQGDSNIVKIPPVSVTPGDKADCCHASDGHIQRRSEVAVRLLDGRRLDFCGHHYDQHAAALAPRIDYVTDTRSKR